MPLVAVYILFEAQVAGALSRAALTLSASPEPALLHCTSAQVCPSLPARGLGATYAPLRSAWLVLLYLRLGLGFIIANRPDHGHPDECGFWKCPLLSAPHCLFSVPY